MFHELARKVLDEVGKSEGWTITARALNRTPEKLMKQLENEDLSFEECLQLLKASRSPDLLHYVIDQFHQIRIKLN